MLFSVVIPTFNREYCILDAINSVLKQKFEDYEIVIIDDGSTDGTEGILQEYLKMGKIKYLKLPVNKGVNYARNFGVEVSIGRWILFLDSDDKLINIDVLTRISFIIQENPSFQLFFFNTINEDNKVMSKLTNYSGEILYHKYLADYYKGEYMPVVRKNIIIANKFIEKLNGCEGITWRKIVKYNKTYLSSEVMRFYRLRNMDRLSIKSNNYDRILKCHQESLKNDFVDLLKFNFFGLIKTILSILYYKLVK